MTFNFFISIEQGVILDRSVYSDLVFTKVVHEDGNIDEDGKPLIFFRHLFYETA